jgi:hypothetical protein
MRRSLSVLFGAAITVSATACGSVTPRPVPAVTGERLDIAEDTLDAVGLRYHTVGGGAFGIVVRSDWLVCGQSPPPRARATTVVLTVARACLVPSVVGETLDGARDELEDEELEVRVHSLDGDPVVIEAFWTVCRQSPAAGVPAQPVDLYVSHDCWWVDA